MAPSKLITCALFGLSAAQKAGQQTPEYHLPLPVTHCTKAGGCSTENHAVTLDSNWRWLHHVGDTNNCYTGNEWNKTYCSSVEECTTNCALDGVDEKTWNGTYGVIAKGNMLNVSYVTQGPYSKNVGSRMFLLEDEDTYKMFKLKNKEFTFDVDVSNLPCGLNGALYFVEMAADGGKSEFPTNEAGARLGTGYCDAQCPHDLKWISGEANLIGWNASKTSPDRGTGHYGTCCAELDIWEANKVSTQMTVHGCSTQGPYRCEGIECGDDATHQRFNGTCDKDGCDFNPFRVGIKDFFGPDSSHTLDSTKMMTVVTQFITADGTDDGDLVEMRRVYYQDGKRIANPTASYGAYDSITDKQCVVQKSAFGDFDDFTPKGGIKAMGDAMGRGMVLTMSLWDDDEVHMIWLDATDPIPPTGQPAKRGAPRGTCPTDSGDPTKVRKDHPHSNVIFANIRYGDINTTVGPPSPPGPPSGCPGGSLSACISLCPSSPPAAYQACVQDCVKRCPSAEVPALSATPKQRASERHPLHAAKEAPADLAGVISHAPLELQLKVAKAKEAAALALEEELEAEIAARDAVMEFEAQDA